VATLVDQLLTFNQSRCIFPSRLGLPAADEARSGQAAQLHDTGKVAVPDGILHKPGPLEPAE
jgi:HD-GYP domain-containing protein (c-di-GMP phosphodiesterase class II)